MNDETTKLPVFANLYVQTSSQPEPRRRDPRNTASLAVTQPMAVVR